MTKLETGWLPAEVRAFVGRDVYAIRALPLKEGKLMAGREEYSLDQFDYLFGQLQGLPDVVQSGQPIIRETAPLVGVTRTYIVQTIRRSQVGDTIFLECTSGDRLIRLVLPPKVSATIARQRDALTKRAQRKHGKRIAQE